MSNETDWGHTGPCSVDCTCLVAKLTAQKRQQEKAAQGAMEAIVAENRRLSERDSSMRRAISDASDGHG